MANRRNDANAADKGIAHQSSIALLLIDVINDVNFEEADQFLEHALPVARRIAELKKACHKADIPVIYANDNFGVWRSDFASVVKHCVDKSSKGRQIAELLKPHQQDYFVLKPKHSAFFSTSLNVLLEYLGAKKLIICGFAGNICVLFTANDAYMREYKLYIPADCVASNTLDENNAALHQMEKLLRADIRKSSDIVQLAIFK